MPKVLLIQPTQYGSKTGEPIRQSRIYLPGLGLPLLAACAPGHWEVELVIEVVDDIDYDSDCDLVGIGAMGHALFRAKDIAREFRRRGKKVFMGGYMVSILPGFVKGHCDSVVIGDGEVSFPQLLKDYEETGELKPIYDHQLSSLAGMPLPRYDLLARKKIGLMMPVQAGRGCPHTCSYCSIACLYRGRYLYRPVDEVMRDIEHLKSLGHKRFFLIDDNIVSNPEYLLELTARIKPLKMTWASQCSLLIAKNDKLLKAVAGSGCQIISIGVESISQEGLNSLNKEWMKVDETAHLLKKVMRAGIYPATEMVVGIDGDTQESLRETARFVIRNKLPAPKFYILTPIAGTDLYKEMKANGRLLHEDYRKYTAADCVFQPKNLSPEELEQAYFKLYKRVYSFAGIFRRVVLNRGFLRRPFLFLFFLFGNLVYKRSIHRGDAPNIL